MRSKSNHRTYPAPLILPAERNDIPRLVEIYVLAEAHDLILTVDSINLSLVRKWLIEILEEQFDGPELRLMKAVDRECGEITALAFWWLRGWGLEKEKNGLGITPGLYGQNLNGIGNGNERAKPFLFPPLLESNNSQVSPSADGPGSPLQKHISKSFKAFEDAWVTRTKYLHLSLLMTDPKYQRRGIGTALLEWGHEFADREGVPCFLIASPVGHPLYAHVGWKEIGVMEVDLKDWAEYAKSGDMGWGIYRYYYMLRLPKDAKS
ncbi:acyl-CoA N-acyltransferase [Cadophora sp. MPI-SDFR-AT-0126]|nr:acyl-CoA N-acyltransferase [Leotiomycetes sp. MPI-SDFR-AT-0126]